MTDWYPGLWLSDPENACSCDLFAWALHKALGYRKFARIFALFRSADTGEVWEDTEHIVAIHPSRKGFVIDAEGVVPIDKQLADLHNAFVSDIAESKATGMRFFWGDDAFVGVDWKPCTFGKCMDALRWGTEDISSFPPENLAKAVAFILEHRKHYT